MIAKEGRIILIPLLLITIPIGIYAHVVNNTLFSSIYFFLGILFLFSINFFRDPKRIAEELKTKGQIVRDFTTGIRAQPLDLKTAAYLDIPIKEGVIITSIAKDSPAQKAKLEYGDIIVAVENIKVLSLDDILEVIEINDIRPGDRIQLKIWRDGRYINRKLKLGKI